MEEQEGRKREEEQGKRRGGEGRGGKERGMEGYATANENPGYRSTALALFVQYEKKICWHGTSGQRDIMKT